MMRWVRLHPYNISQEVQLLVEHYGDRAAAAQMESLMPIKWDMGSFGHACTFLSHIFDYVYTRLILLWSSGGSVSG